MQFALQINFFFQHFKWIVVQIFTCATDLDIYLVCAVIAVGICRGKTENKAYAPVGPLWVRRLEAGRRVGCDEVYYCVPSAGSTATEYR